MTERERKILTIAVSLVTTLQLPEKMNEWIISSKVPMKQRKKIHEIASQHNSKLRSAAIELRNAVQNK